MPTRRSMLQSDAGMRTGRARVGGAARARAAIRVQYLKAVLAQRAPPRAPGRPPRRARKGAGWGNGRAGARGARLQQYACLTADQPDPFPPHAPHDERKRSDGRDRCGAAAARAARRARGAGHARLRARLALPDTGRARPPPRRGGSGQERAAVDSNQQEASRNAHARLAAGRPLNGRSAVPAARATQQRRRLARAHAAPAGFQWARAGRARRDQLHSPSISAAARPLSKLFPPTR